MGRDSDSRRPSWVHRLQYGVFLTVEAMLRRASVERVVKIGRWLGVVAWWWAGSYRQLALKNLDIAYGDELTAGQKRALARESFARLGANFLCGLKLPLMTQQEVESRVRMEGLEHVQAADAGKRNIVYAVCHLSCWELLTQVPSLFVFGRTPGSIYQSLGNPLLNDLILRRREKLGYRLFDRADGFAEPMKFVREMGCLGVLVDQHAGDHGVWSPFFGRLASTTPLAALLAKRGNALLLYMTLNDDGPGRWVMRCLPPIADFASEKKVSVEAVTARLNGVVEQVIRAAPADWFWVHNRWKTPNPNFLIHHYRRGLALPEGMESAQLKRFELIVRSPNWLGDACMAFPAVRALKRGRPDLRLTVFGPEKLRELWEALPEVDAYVGKVNKEGLLAVGRRLRESGVRYDAGVLLTNSTRSTLEFWLARIPRLIGYKGSLRARLLNQVCPGPKPGQPPWHHAQKYLRVAEHAGAVVDAPELWVTERRVVEGVAEGVAEGGKLRVGVCAGAEYGPAKRWPLERFAAVANQVSEEVGEGRPIEWVLFGAPGEAAMGEALAALVKVPHVNRVGKTKLSELIVALQGCRLLVTNDTGTMHLAAALGVPTVSLFGSTEPSLTGPLGDQHRVLRHHVPCSPCFKRECPFGHYDCLTGLTVDRVVREVKAALVG